MTNYTAVVDGVDGIRKSDEIVLMQASTITPVVFDFIQADATPYIFESGDIISGTFVDDVTLEEFSITGTITPATGGNTASWARSVADTGTPAEYRLYMKVARGGVFDYTEPSPMTILSVPGVGITPPSPLVGVSIAEAAWLTLALDTVPDASDLITSADVDIKQDKDTDATASNVAIFDDDGQTVDAGFAMSWNADDETVDVPLTDDVTLQIGHELLFDAKNGTGVDVADGVPVMFSEPVGASGKVEFQLAIADGSLKSEWIMGLTTEPIGNGAFGKITAFGKIRGIDTTGTPYGETWANGDLIYVGTTAGALTNTEPNAPNQRILVATVVIAHAQNGTLQIRPTWNPKLTELDDVNGTPFTADGQFLVWDNTQGYHDGTANISDFDAAGSAAAVQSNLTAVATAAEMDAPARIIANKLGTGTNLCGVFREDTGGAHSIWLYRHIGGGRYWCVELRETTQVDGATLHSIYRVQVRTPYTSINDDDASISFSGIWSQSTSASAYLGTYAKGSVVGGVMSWTTPADTTAIGARFFNTTNGGITKVSINGDATRATLLETAQDLVDNGDAPSTVLVANGGALNPTDRVWNQYSASTNGDIITPLANDLAAGEHVVDFTCVGEQPTLSTDIRAYIGGMFSTQNESALTTNNYIQDIILASSSVYEYAIKPSVDGFTDETRIGNRHGYDNETSFSVSVDSGLTSLADGDYISGLESVVVIRDTELTNIDTGAAVVCNVKTRYEMSINGMRVSYSLSWLVDGIAIAPHYSAMMAMENRYNIGRNSGLPAEVTMDGDDGSVTNNAKGLLGYIRDSAYTQSLQLSQLSINRFDSSDKLFLWAEDRAGGNINKFYATVDIDRAFSSGDVWENETLYRLSFSALM